MIAKLMSYVIQVRRLPVWCNMVAETTIDAFGKRSTTLKTTGHEKARVSVCLAAKAEETKLKPMVYSL